MKITYHVIPFHCQCGRKGTILEIAARADGMIVIGGLCVLCGKQFYKELSAAQMIAASALMDRQDEIKENPIEALEAYEFTGKPN